MIVGYDSKDLVTYPGFSYSLVKGLLFGEGPGPSGLLLSNLGERQGVIALVDVPATVVGCLACVAMVSLRKGKLLCYNLDMTVILRI